MKAIGFRRHLSTYIPAIFVCAMLSLVVISVVVGRPFRVGRLPDKGKNFGCGTCHVNPRGGSKRTPFGEDYRKVALKAGDKYTEDLGELDSDGDGFTNDQEFAAKLIEHGMEFVDVDREAFRKRVVAELPKEFADVWKPNLWQRIADVP